jgi:hypothetical protein
MGREWGTNSSKYPNLSKFYIYTINWWLARLKFVSSQCQLLNLRFNFIGKLHTKVVYTNKTHL